MIQLKRLGPMVALLVLPLLLSGCTIPNPFGNKAAPVILGVYKTADRGDTWTPVNNILSTGAARPTLSATSVASLIMDPTDRQTLYLGSVGQGLYYTYDGAASWLPSGPIRVGTINAVALPTDVASRCTVYLATANRIMRTTDCGRSWEQVYLDTRVNEQVLSLVVSVQDAKVVYAGLTTGDIFKSVDGGKSWLAIARLPAAIQKIIPHTLNPNTLYAVVKGKGVWRTQDAGKTWLNTGDTLKNFSGSNNIIDVIIDPARPETLIAATTYGLLRSTDAGQTWLPIPLLTAPGKAAITSVAINPNKPAEIYYATGTTFYRSSDAGQTWTTKELPVAVSGSRLIVDPKLSNVLYFATLRAAK